MKLEALKYACAVMGIFLLSATVAQAFLPVLRLVYAGLQDQAPQTEAKKVQEAAKPAAPVATDAGFQEALADYQMILREIERIENATGTVEISVSVAQLRQRGEVKLGHLKAWMKEHGVGDDWRYDPGAKAFAPPAPAVKKEAPAAGKP